MGFTVMRCFEYVFQCDECDDMVVYHTGDVDFARCVNREIRVHDSESARKASGYHIIGGKYLCDNCYNLMKERKRRKRKK